MIPTARCFPHLFAWLALAFALCLAQPLAADSGPYIGASIGQADTDVDFGSGDFDDDASAWKVFGGYNFDVLLVNLGLEAAYMDFGSTSDQVGIGTIHLDTDAYAGFGVVGLDLGVIGLFAKAGMARWDMDSRVPMLGRGGDSGTDPAYGIGARFTLRSIELRAEYEYFDIDVDGGGSSDLSMISAGVAWTF